MSPPLSRSFGNPPDNYEFYVTQQMARKTRNERNRSSQQQPTTFLGRFNAALAQRRPGLETVVLVLAVLGILVTFHLWIQQGRGFDQGCWGFNPPQGAETTFNCSVVVESDAGKLFGISNVYWGMGFYLVVGLLSFLMAGREGKSRTSLHRYRALLIGGGFLYSIYLVNFQLNSIGEMCALCMTSAGISTLLFLTQYGSLIFGSPSDATTQKPALRMYKTMAIAVAILAIADYTYFYNLEPADSTSVATAAETNPAAALASGSQDAADPSLAQCTFDNALAPFPRYRDLIYDDEPFKGTEGAPVTVIEIFDPNCPHCQLVHPIMQEVIAQHGDKAQFFLKPFPLWDHSMTQIEAMYVAKERGVFFEMIDAQIAEQQTRGIPMSRLREIGAELDIPTELMNARLRNQLYRSIVLEHRSQIAETKLGGVPAILINGRFVGTKSVECIGKFIEDAAG